MSRTKAFAALAFLGFGAAACSTAGTNELSAANNPSLNSVHQPVVQRTDFVFDVAVEGDSVSAAEQQRLRGWFDSIGLAYGDTVSVDDSQTYGSSGARDDVARVAADYGLLLADGAPVTVGQVPAGSVRVVASRSTASVPGCPDWAASNNGVTPPQGTSSNFGCSTNSNLAAMIADPEDLIRGRNGSGSGSAATAGRAIKTYRELPPSGRQGLPATTTTDR